MNWTFESACSALRQDTIPPPYSAIKFLRKQPTTPKLIGEIVKEFESALSCHYESGGFFNFSIAAEKHLVPELIEPTIHLITATENIDFCHEQASFLLEKLAKKFPDEVIPKVQKAIDACLEINSRGSYLFLFDVFYFADHAYYLDWYKKVIANKNLYWRDPFLSTLGHFGVKGIRPELEEYLGELIKQKAHPSDINEIKEALKVLDGKAEGMKPWSEERGDWESFLQRRVKEWAEDDDFEEDPEQEFVKKIKRNAPCPCGSKKSDGTFKKYKNCCGRDN